MALAVALLTVLAVRAYDSQRGPPLELWHTFVPHELTARQIDASDWAAYLAAEATSFAEVRAEVTDKLGPESQNAGNRYYAGSPIYPARFAKDWKSLLHHGPGLCPGRRGRDAARAHRFALQPAPHRPALP